MQNPSSASGDRVDHHRQLCASRRGPVCCSLGERSGTRVFRDGLVSLSSQPGNYMFPMTNPTGAPFAASFVLCILAGGSLCGISVGLLTPYFVRHLLAQRYLPSTTTTPTATTPIPTPATTTAAAPAAMCAKRWTPETYQDLLLSIFAAMRSEMNPAMQAKIMDEMKSRGYDTIGWDLVRYGNTLRLSFVQRSRSRASAPIPIVLASAGR